jgi:hypothetical protein
MPRKVFVAGEILTASDVNVNLMDQAVMSFAGTAARGSAIPSPVEGMVTYLNDLDRLEVYTTSWGPVGKLVDFKTVTKTDSFSASIASGASAAVTGLSITHEVSDPANKLIITTFFGLLSNSSGFAEGGIAVNDGSALLSIGNADGSRIRTTAGGINMSTSTNFATVMPHITIVHTPGAGSKTYSTHVINVRDSTQTLYVNRSTVDTASANFSRSASALHIMEVAA